MSTWNTLLTEESIQAAKTKHKLEAKLKCTQAPIHAREHDIASIHQEETIAAHNLQNAKHALQEEWEKIWAASGQSDEAKRTTTLKQVEEEQEQLQEQIQQWKQLGMIRQHKYEGMEPSIDQAKSQGDSINKQLKGIDFKLRQLESNEADSLSLFGCSCANVDQLVK